ncbi:MAG: HAD-IIB family hydrolase, partial [Pseudomonadota bacterium]
LIIFTDLDGTLLDHETYSWKPALPALNELKRLDVPLIMASSKTAAEIAPVRAKAGFVPCPAIVENGAGILPPGDFTDDHDVASYHVIRDALAEAPDELKTKFTGFGDMTIEEIAASTGLPVEGAALAARRAFSEPGIWSGTDTQRAAFINELQKFGVTGRYGGRYLTLSLGGTKAERMDEITQTLGLTNPFSVALGDAPNDVEMIEKANLGFIIKNTHGKPIQPLPGENDGHIKRTELPGPAGWNAAVLSVLSQRTITN